MNRSPQWDENTERFANKAMDWGDVARESARHDGAGYVYDVRNTAMMFGSILQSCSAKEMRALFSTLGIDLAAMFGGSAGNVADVLEHEHNEWGLSTPKSPGQASWKVKCVVQGCNEERHILKAK